MVNNLLEDIQNYSNIKNELFKYYDNIINLQEDILYYMNDYCPIIYGLSKSIIVKMKRNLAFTIKEKKYVSLYSLQINNDNYISKINRFLGLLNVKERFGLLQYIQEKYKLYLIN